MAKVELINPHRRSQMKVTKAEQMRRAAKVAVIVALAALAGSAAMAQQAQTPPASAARAERYVAIGCVASQGSGAASSYTITDSRGDKPTVYRLDGDAAQLQPHVGHTVEVAGPIVQPGAGTRPPVLKVSSLVWLMSSCKK